MPESNQKAQHTGNISVEGRTIPGEQETQNAGHGPRTESSNAE